MEGDDGPLGVGAVAQACSTALRTSIFVAEGSTTKT